MRSLAAGGMGFVALAALAGSVAVAAQPSGMGPQDVAEIPIERVPGWVSEHVLRFVPDPASEGDASAEVLAVVRDPRDVPVDRFLYALTDDGEVIVHPQADAIRRSLEGRGHSAVAVYVRVTAPAEICDGCYEPDPFYVDSLANMELNPESYGAPWDNVGVAYGEDGVAVLPCLEPMTIEEGVRPFSAPDTGTRAEPDEYLPPMPHYVVTDNSRNDHLRQGQMVAGEVRQGWLLCLAPGVPAEEVRIVEAHWSREDRSDYVAGEPLWVPIREMAIGEWYLLEDRQVVGWNEGEWRTGSEPARVGEQVVYEGDVWVSVAQALRHAQNPRVVNGIPEGSFEEELRLQMYFEGMEALLQTWDQLELVDGWDVFGSQDTTLRRGDVSATRVDLRAAGSALEVFGGAFGWDGSQRERTEVMWVYPRDIEEPGGAGRIGAWRVEFEEIDERDLTTDAICTVAECVMMPVMHYGEEVETAIPVIPVGTRARGLRVESVNVVQGSILAATDFDVFVDEGESGYVTGAWSWVVAEVSAEGAPIVNARNLRGDSAVDGESSYPAWQYVDYGISGGRVSVGGTWRSYFRAGRDGLALVSEIHSEWSLTDVVLTASGGPVWKLR